MSLVFNGRALWAFAGVVLLMAIATGQGELGLATVIGATTLIELLTWLGPFGGRRDARPSRRAAR